MFWLLLIAAAVLVLLLAPLRRAFFSNWRFTVPATGGLVGGALFTAFLVSFGIPGWVMLVLPPLVALHMGAGCKAWLDENLGPPRNQRSDDGHETRR